MAVYEIKDLRVTYKNTEILLYITYQFHPSSMFNGNKIALSSGPESSPEEERLMELIVEYLTIIQLVLCSCTYEVTYT